MRRILPILFVILFSAAACVPIPPATPIPPAAVSTARTTVVCAGPALRRSPQRPSKHLHRQPI